MEKLPMPDITLEDQLKCARRELKQRYKVYPRLAYMSDEAKAHEIAAMQAIIATLEGLIAAQSPQLTLVEG